MAASKEFLIEREYLYRVLRPNEDPKEGLKAKSPSSTVSISDHVANGSKRCSQFLSACTDKSTAERWANLGMSRKRLSSKTIVKIHLEKLRTASSIKRVIDLTNSVHRSVYCNGNSRAESLAIRWDEAIIEGEIPAVCITETWTVRR